VSSLVSAGNPNSHQATSDEQGSGSYAQKGRIDGDTTALREVFLLLHLVLILFLLFLRKGGSGGNHHRRQE
jgi:hypothetical protein